MILCGVPACHALVVCVLRICTHREGTNQSWKEAANYNPDITEAHTYDEVNDGEDQANGRDRFIVAALRRLHIGGGCSGLGYNHCGGGTSLHERGRTWKGRAKTVLYTLCSNLWTSAPYVQQSIPMNQ